jgi:MFS family permease
LNVELGLCGTLMPFFLNYLLKNEGWRGAVMTVGGISMALALANLVFVLRRSPGWERDRRDVHSNGKLADPSPSTLARSKHLLPFALSIVFVSAESYSLLSQMIQVNVDKGIAMSVALTALSAVSLSSVCSRTVVGAMLDRTFAPVLAATIFVFIATGVTLLNYTRAAWGIYLTPLLVGAGLGGRSLPSPHKYSVDHLSDSP